METKAPIQCNIERENFNKIVFDDETTGDKKLLCYTWIYRWKAPTEFSINLPGRDNLLPTKKTIQGRQDEQTRYLFNVLENSQNIVIYHKAGPSKLKNCSDVDHFHMLTWHSCHPTSQHSFNILKRLLKTRSSHPYNVFVQKVYNPHGLCKYLTEDPSARYIVTADNIKTTRQKHVLQTLTHTKKHRHIFL